MLQPDVQHDTGRTKNILENLNLPRPSKNENNLPQFTVHHENGFQDLSYGEFLICKMMNFCFPVSSALHQD